jgi:hypothetical protein
VKQASFRFYAELNDFLPPVRRATRFLYRFTGTPSVERLIEELGVPHAEVRLVLVNGRAVDPDHHVEDGDRISVYPAFRSLEVTPG